METKKIYIRPEVEVHDAHMPRILGLSNPDVPKSGYAIDNYEHEDSKIISIWEQAPDDDEFLEID